MKDGEGRRLTLIDGAKQQDPGSRPTARGIISSELSGKAAGRPMKEILLARPVPGPFGGRDVAGALRELSSITPEDVSCDEKARCVLAAGRRYFGHEAALLISVQQGSAEVVAVDADASLRESGEPLGPGFTYELEGTLCAASLQQSEPFCFVKGDAYIEQRRLARDSYIGCALRSEGAPYGVLSFSSRTARLSYDEQDRAFMLFLARLLESEAARSEVHKRLSYRNSFERLLFGISRDFINLALEDVDEGIRGALRTIGDFSGVDLSFVFLFKENSTKMDITHWWAADNLVPRFRVRDIPLQDYPWSMGKILNREVADMTDIELLADGSPEKRFADEQGIRSAMLVPMVYSGNCIGLVGFACRNGKREFDGEVVKLLEMVGHLLASAVEYKRSAEAFRALEQQMLHAQKLESLGLLAGGIAHDFNNLLMSILGNAAVALRELPFNHPVRSMVSRIERIGQDAAALSNKLLAYAGKGRFFVEHFNLSDCIDEMLSFLKSAVSKKHKLICNFAADLPMIQGDKSQLSQLIMNLVSNASDAIGEKPGTITLSTGLLAVDHKYLLGTYLRDDTPEGVYVYLRVADTGCGMEEAVLSRIFDPFFSTKSAGQGLGLAAVIGIVRAHHGTIKVRSTPGEGSTFTVLLPCAANQGMEASRGVPAAAGSNTSVMVVDDEEAVLDVVSEVLQSQGYAVVKAQSGEEALNKFDAAAGAVTLAIVDMSMPDMSGEEVCRRLRRIKPALQLIMTSGYSETEMSSRVGALPRAVFLQKPYLPDALIEQARKLLGINQD